MELKLRLDVPALREDARKLAIILIGAGLVGTIIDSDSVTANEGLALFGLGAIVWSAALLLRSGE